MTTSNDSGVEIPFKNPFRLRLFGPAIVLLAFGQATGELIHWPYLTVKYGLYFLFLLIPACLIQLPMFAYLARHAVVFGESHFPTLVKSNRSFAVLTWVIFLITTIWIASYTASAGIALTKMFNAIFATSFDLAEAGKYFALGLNILYFIILITTRRAHRLISTFMSSLAALSLIVVLVIFGWTIFNGGFKPEFFRAIYDFKLTLPLENWDHADAKLLVTAIVFAGLGGLWNVLYSGWVRNEGMGMSGLNSSEFNDYRPAFPVIKDTLNSKHNYAKSMRLLNHDLWIGLGVNAIIIALLMYITYVSFPADQGAPTGIGIITALGDAAAYENPFIAGVFYLFIGLFLADTWLTAADSLSKVNTSMRIGLLHSSSKNDDITSEKEAKQNYIAFLLFMLGMTFVSTFIAQPQQLNYLNGILSAFGSVVLIIGLFINERMLRRLYPWLPSMPIMTFMLSVSFIAYLGLAIAYVCL